MLLSAMLLAGMALAMPEPPPTEAFAVAQVPPQPASAEAEVAAGLAAFRRLRFRDAERHFQAAVEADPQSAAAAFYLAYTVYKIAEPKQPFHPDKQRAAQLFARAYELDPGFEPVWSTPWRPR